jgi:BA14K-like protein
MINRVPALAAAGLLAAGLGAFASAASATPLSDALAIRNAAPNNVESVRWAGGGGGWRGGGGGGWRGGGGGWGGGGWRGGGWGGGGGWGWGVGAGIVGGAIIGGALAAPYYGYGPYYPAYPAPYPYYGPVYDAPPPGAYGPPPGYDGPPPGAGAYGPPPGGGGDAGYCAQRYRSYDPQSGTYMGTDGLRHPCP